MKKSDQTIHRICVSGIWCSTFDDAQLNLSAVYEDVSDFENIFNHFDLDRLPNELPICSCTINNDEWSLLTSIRLITSRNGQINEANMEVARHGRYGDFKGYSDKLYTIGFVEFEDGIKHEYYIETGKASMIMVQGVKYRIQIQSNSEDDNLKMIQRWTNRGIIKTNPNNV